MTLLHASCLRSIVFRVMHAQVRFIDLLNSIPARASDHGQEEAVL